MASGSRQTGALFGGAVWGIVCALLVSGCIFLWKMAALLKVATWEMIQFVSIVEAWIVCAIAVALYGTAVLLKPVWVRLAYALAAMAFVVHPRLALRVILWTARHLHYRLTVTGVENVPTAGGALLVANHTSPLDFLVISLSLPRPVRFVVGEGAGGWLERLAERHMRVLRAPLDCTPTEIAERLRQARQALEAGELVCMFPEGVASWLGYTLGFMDWFERVLKGSRFPLIPVYLDWRARGVASQPASYLAGRPARRLSRSVAVCFGKPLPSETSGPLARQAVLELGVLAFAQRSYPPLHHVFIRQARRLAGKPLFSDTSGKEVTYRKALITCMLLADYLKRRCAGQEMVGIMLPATAAGAICNIAVTMAGKVSVNLNFTASKDALDSAISQCGIQTILTAKSFLEKAGIQRRPEMLALEDVAGGFGALAKMRAALKALLLPVLMLERRYGGGLSAGDLATVIFSSGSTGVPKGVMLTHGNVISNIDAMSVVYPVPADACICGILPLFHSFGYTVTLWFPVAVGASVAYHPNPVDARAIGELVCRKRCTLLLSTPTFCRSYIRGCQAHEFGALRDVIVGAEKLGGEVADAFQRKFGIRPVEGYGTTECSPVVSLNVRDFRGAGVFQRGGLEGTVGRALPGLAAKTVDADSGADLPAGARGVLCIKGASIMAGYLNQPAKTQEVLKDGWYWTGDVAEIDGDGFIRIVDRVSRFSKIAGEMVPHEAVEKALAAILGTDGSTAAVTALPDAEKGERLVVVHLKFTEPLDVIWEKLNASNLPKLYVPRKDCFVEVEEIPLLGSGKVALKRLREIAALRAGMKR